MKIKYFCSLEIHFMTAACDMVESFEKNFLRFCCKKHLPCWHIVAKTKKVESERRWRIPWIFSNFRMYPKHPATEIVISKKQYQTLDPKGVKRSSILTDCFGKLRNTKHVLKYETKKKDHFGYELTKVFGGKPQACRRRCKPN